MLPGGHLPTVWGKKFRRQRLLHDRVERLTTPDGDHLTLVNMLNPTSQLRGNWRDPAPRYGAILQRLADLGY